MITKKRTNGNNTKNHDKAVSPVLHIKFRTHVQNTMYNIFIENMMNVLLTSQL
jgi:hypothetical protein